MVEVRKRERALLMMADLSHGGVDRLKKLYAWFDANAVNVARFMLQRYYQQIDILSNRNATYANFMNHLTTLARDPGLKAVDVILVLHGEPGRLHFRDGGVSSARIKEQLQAEDLKHRLRLLYSSACHGATHAGDFVEAGFRTASGAEGICANGPYDFPVQLLKWRENRTYKSVVGAGNNEFALTALDLIAKELGFSGVNSHRIIAGKKLTRITTPAQ